jgi:hypothetical protein
MIVTGKYLKQKIMRTVNQLKIMDSKMQGIVFF